MKKLLTFAVSLFTIGFILKFFHIHYNAILMILGIILMVVIFGIAIFKKQEGLNPIVGFAFTSWLVLLLVTVKYFPFATIILSIACLLTLIAVIIAFKQGDTRQLIMLGFSLILTLTFYFMPSDTRYYLMSIKWNQEIASDYFSYDKYSWFLYQNDHYEEAMKASEMAKKIVEQAEDSRWADLISQHQEQIKNKNWKKYR